MGLLTLNNLFMKVYLLPHDPENGTARKLIAQLTSSLGAHGVSVASSPTTLIGRLIVWLRQLWIGDLCIAIGFGQSHVARNHGTIAIYQDGDDFARAVAQQLAECTADKLGTQLRGFKRCGYKSDRVEAFGDLRRQHSPSIRHNVLLMVCYETNDSNMQAFENNNADLIAELTAVIKYWVQ